MIFLPAKPEYAHFFMLCNIFGPLRLKIIFLLLRKAVYLHTNLFYTIFSKYNLKAMANWFECKIRYDKLQENGTAVKK